MAQSTLATLAGFPILASSPIVWEFTNGVQPYTTTVDMDPESARKVIGAAGRGNKFTSHVILRFQTGTGGLEQSEPESGEPVARQVVIVCWVLGIKPGQNPHIVKVQIADIRWLWKYIHLGPNRYNWRRNVSFKRLEAVDGESLLNDVIPDVWYAPWSLKDPEGTTADVWNAEEVMESLLLQTQQAIFDGGYVAGYYSIDASLRDVPIENLLVDGPADQSIARALSYLPGAGIFVDRGGRVRVYPKFNGAELRFYKSMRGVLGEKVAQGHVGWMNAKLIRPRKVTVLFTVEAELRFDSDGDEEDEDGQGFTSGVLTDPDPLARKLRNVCPVPDFESPITKQVSGTWMRLGQLMQEWRTGGSSRLDRYYKFEFVRRAFTPFLDYWGALLLTGTLDPDVNHAGRVNALLQHYRRTFQIHPKWWSRILSIHARRVALIDPESGSTAPASVWADCCRLGSERTFSRSVAGGGNKFNLPYAINCKSYPVGDPLLANIAGTDSAVAFPITKKSIQAECRVSILDAEQGVIGLDYIPDVHAEFSTILPSMMTSGGASLDANGMPTEAGPGADITNRDMQMSFNAIGANLATSSNLKVPELVKDHRVAVILTAIPAIWNHHKFDSGTPRHPHAGGFSSFDSDQFTTSVLYKVTIDPAKDKDLRAILVAAFNASGGGEDLDFDTVVGLDECQGPPMEVRIGPAVEVARIAWADERAFDIQKLFGIHEDGSPETPPNLEGLVLNAGNSNEDGASLRKIALSAAASVYAEYVNHLEGSASFALGETIDGVQPQGWMDSAGVELSTTGEGSIKVDMPAKVEKLPMDLFMNRNTKSVIAKLARPD